VPRSPSAPHAILYNDALRYAKRNGSTTRYLTEPEVAAAYRDRLLLSERQTERAIEVETEALRRLDPVANHPWLLLTLVPELPGDLVIDREELWRFQQLVVNKDVFALTVRLNAAFTRARVGRRRLLADGNNPSKPLARYGSPELHTDG
jgi:hypothetical protein